jgi:GNAT superfamily N-acetyltransferase
LSRAASAVWPIVNLEREHEAAASDLLVRASAFDPGVARVAAEKLFGASPLGLEAATIGVFHGAALVGVAVLAGRFLRILAVDPAARGQGVGSALLADAESRARRGGATKLRAGGQPGNYLSPGVDERDAASITWLEKRGFEWSGGAANLAVPLVGNAHVSAVRAQALDADARARGYDVRRAAANTDDRPALAALAGGFSRAWAFEVDQALALTPPAVFVACERASGALVAFAAHDGNNRGLGWFGPAGTAPAHRGAGLGGALLVHCLRDIAAAGHERAVIAWIGPRGFYEKLAGAEDDRHFVIMDKSLAPGGATP